MKEEIRQITTEDKEYPKKLREIADPPQILYARGDLKAAERCFAIVGTRLCSPYGKQVAMEIAGDLTQAGLTIVSGLAPGIDTAAHKAVVEAGKRTIAVLGTGVDEKSLYPKENIGLARKIVETGGAVISEYPPGTSGSKITFPHRNRIISGLSLGVLIVEAKQKSGALITANDAKRQGRKVFAVPGPVHSLNSKGPHILIKRGAILAENANDILKALKLNLVRFNLTRLTAGESGEEDLILGALGGGALDIEKIIEKTKLPAATTASAVALMELQGKIRNLGRNVYGLNR
ncbi:MAG: DNA protecting protein DprA [Candidatus Wildermuthbacteria bacterium RIFCSPHIGHO2_01_FULL_47_27]|uniref:DNA protecting protein DprA n=2 Tax=Candidatus Wildermuthiibacteriota TaxID=1817923 RepID=A0A1G2RRE9_9BACT|nr:MAG: protecting protein DprA protein [Parcubacteria group bacterium GW2011_GWA2_47_9]OHA65006.1 MAG: DNA protecting protein DprA [Candidatus Wildermuthbacteria bacterium RIFCSPHIGHO2_01_FULL_47_27]OHA67002.1 MAG: DNA protecting protein DprA [Candidatus Wildermuthbacteria bacterium RIFCSPHIGHO2_02_FULL_47_17]OHA75440.1 MAG: DNA protecting protein DprA [Candidatus Wildermuthbacteria bacterium RIFCSPLOWO2_01_FULL_48_35]